jgi:hypothetical protein
MQEEENAEGSHVRIYAFSWKQGTQNTCVDVYSAKQKGAVTPTDHEVQASYSIP